MNWFFKLGDNFKFDNDNNTLVISLEQKRNFTGKKGEDVLILEKRKKEWEFTAHYKILDIEIKNPELKLKIINITLLLIKRFEGEKLLEDYIYSLRRITNYTNPIKHFNRKYNRVFNPEFKAIMEDKIYLKRTLLGTILNSLHYEHQKAFITYVGVENPELLVDDLDVDTTLDLLVTYLNFAIIMPAQYLMESAGILRTIVSETDYQQIGFSSNTESIKPKDIQLIQPQALIAIEYLNQLSNIANQKNQLDVFENNSKFKRLFKKTRLPISFNI